MNSVYERIYQAVKLIPRGKVASYGQVAALAGIPRGARVVGNALHVNPDPENVPCYRVVRKNGSLTEAFAFGGENVQRRLLENDGVEFNGRGRVIMDKYCIRL